MLKLKNLAFNGEDILAECYPENKEEKLFKIRVNTKRALIVEIIGDAEIMYARQALAKIMELFRSGEPLPVECFSQWY